MDSFEFLTRDSSVLGPHHLDKFAFAWSDFDPHATTFINFDQLIPLLQKLEPPLGMGDSSPKRLVYKRLIEMDIPIDKNGKANFTTVLIALISRVFHLYHYCLHRIFLLCL